MRIARPRFTFALFTFLACAVTSQLHAGFIVAPTGLDNVEGNSQNGAPFQGFGPGSIRYQQVYGADNFAALSGPVLITQIAFRPDVTDGSGSGPFFFNLPDIQFSLSTTHSQVDALNANLDSNLGIDNTVVFSGAWFYASQYTGTGPKDFDIVLNLQHPFTYDPRLGNLLMEVRNNSYLQFPRFADAQGSGADSVSRRIEAPFGSDVDTLGLVTKFTYIVPEPQPFALLSLFGLVYLVSPWFVRIFRQGRRN